MPPRTTSEKAYANSRNERNLLRNLLHLATSYSILLLDPILSTALQLSKYCDSLPYLPHSPDLAPNDFAYALKEILGNKLCRMHERLASRPIHFPILSFARPRSQ